MNTPNIENTQDFPNKKKSVSGISGKQIQSVQRAIDILNCFTAANPVLSLAQISTRLGLNKGTVHGILNTLRINGYINQNHSGQYMLGAEIFNKTQLASGTERSFYIDHAHQYLQELSDRFQANGTLFSAEGRYLLFLCSTEPRNSTFIIRRASSRLPLFCSASGKLLLCYLPEKELQEYFREAPFPAYTSATKTTEAKLREEFEKIRANGYSYENNELFEGVAALSVPIFSGYDNHLFGMLSLTGMSMSIFKRKKEIFTSLSQTVRKLQQSVWF